MAFVDDFWPHRNVGGVLRPSSLDSRSGLAAGTGHGRAWRCPSPQGTRAVGGIHTGKSHWVNLRGRPAVARVDVW